MHNELHLQVKWLQMELHDIESFGTKGNCCRIARKPRGKRRRGGSRQGFFALLMHSEGEGLS
jgi:hypothetical protein